MKNETAQHNVSEKVYVVVQEVFIDALCEVHQITHSPVQQDLNCSLTSHQIKPCAAHDLHILLARCAKIDAC